MKKEKLKFCFKGNRNYVHGTDMFNNLINILGKDIINIDFMIYKKTDKNIILSDSKAKLSDNVIFKFLYLKKGQEKLVYGLETDEKLNCRYDYDEESIVKVAKIDIPNKSIILDKKTKYSFIENVVAINKYLLNSLFIDKKGKWYFTRIQLKGISKEYLPLKLVFKNSFNLKLTKTEILTDNKKIGYIYFSLV